MVGRVSAIFATPIPAVMAMEWSEILGWFAAADEVHGETWGLLPSLLVGKRE